MGLSKKTRFEVFKRDEFTCQYCGQTPPAVTLEVDHIDPKSKGGGDGTINLITACFDCNRGKSDRILGDVHPRPDANLKYLKIQQEIMEAKRFLEAQEELENLKYKMELRIMNLWADHVTEDPLIRRPVVVGWINTYALDEIEYAIRKTGVKFKTGQFGHTRHPGSFLSAVKYTAGIMRNVKKEAEASA